MKRLPIIDLFLSIISIWWAICLFSNQHMFDHVPNLFRIFAKVSQEDGWGVYFLMAAFVKVIAIVTDNIKLRKLGLYLSFFIYGLICTGYILSSEPISPGTGIHFALCVLALIGVRVADGDIEY